MTRTFCDVCGKETKYIKISIPRYRPTICNSKVIMYQDHVVNYEDELCDVCESCLVKITNFIEGLK